MVRPMGVPARVLALLTGMLFQQFDSRWPPEKPSSRPAKSAGFPAPNWPKRWARRAIISTRSRVGLRNPSLAMMARWVKALGFGASLDLFRTTTTTKRAA